MPNTDLLIWHGPHKVIGLHGWFGRAGHHQPAAAVGNVGPCCLACPSDQALSDTHSCQGGCAQEAFFQCGCGFAAFKDSYGAVAPDRLDSLHSAVVRAPTAIQGGRNKHGRDRTRVGRVVPLCPCRGLLHSSDEGSGCPGTVSGDLRRHAPRLTKQAPFTAHTEHPPEGERQLSVFILEQLRHDPSNQVGLALFGKYLKPISINSLADPVFWVLSDIFNSHLCLPCPDKDTSIPSKASAKKPSSSSPRA